MAFEPVDYQLWFRDPQVGPEGFNLTDALHVETHALIPPPLSGGVPAGRLCCLPGGRRSEGAVRGVSYTPAMGVLDSASRCLRAGLALQCLAAAYLAGVHYSSVNTWLLMTAGSSEGLARRVDGLAVLLLLLVACSCLLRPARVLFALAGVWMALVALATLADHGNAFAHLAPFTHALRYVAPLVLILWWPAPGPSREPRLVVRTGTLLLRLALAATFCGHGLQALGHHPPFVDLAIGTARRFGGWRLDQTSAEASLTVIGAIDLLLGLGVVVGRWRWLVAYMAVWGLVTALSRVLHSGTGSWYLTLLRAENCMAPLALWFLWRPAPMEPRTHALDTASLREPATGSRHPAD